MCWSALADAVPLYPLHALLFADSGPSEGAISGLFAIWTAVAVLAEVPCGALADRHPRRAALAAAGMLQAAGYVALDRPARRRGLRIGFGLWGVGGSLSSGSIQALVHDALAVQVPLAGVASLLFWAGGYAPAGWVSVGVCLAASAVAWRLREHRPAPEPGEDELGHLAMLRAGVGAASRSAGLRAAAIVVVALTGFDALEEYFPLLASDRGVPPGVIPPALLGVSVARCGGRGSGGAGDGPPRWHVAGGVAGPAALLAAAGLSGSAAGLVGVAAFYGVQQLALVVADAPAAGAHHRPRARRSPRWQRWAGSWPPWCRWGPGLSGGGVGLVIALAVPAVPALGGRLSAGGGRGRRR